MSLPSELSSAPRPWLAAYGPAGIDPVLTEPPFRNLGEFAQRHCRRWARESAHRQAYTCVLPNGMNGSLGFAQVDEWSDAFAAYLREVLRLAPGDRVGVQLPNGLAYPVVAFGVFKAGCVLVNLNPLYTSEELAHPFADAELRAIVVVDLFANKLAPIFARQAPIPVIVAAIPEFFPAIPRLIVRGVQKVWNRVLPPITVPHVRLREALSLGQRAQAARAATHAPGSAGVASASAGSDYWTTVARDDLAVLQYTGGTTGVSKGAMLTHANLLNNVSQMLAMGATHMKPGVECVLTALPLYHIFAFTANLLGFLSLGARNLLIPNPRPVQNLQRAIENHRVTWITGVNTLFNALLNEEWFVAYPPRHLKASIAGGTALHQVVAARWQSLTGTPLVEGYGLTETSPVVSFHPLQGDVRPGSIGIPAPGTDLRLITEAGSEAAPGEPGEIWVRGPQVMLGYWRQPAETAAVLKEGWLATGDIATLDADGFLRIVDRKKDLILVSGFNVYPNEVEAVIARLEAVLEVAVVGVPDELTGEAVRAYVVANPAVSSAIPAEEVIAHCRKSLASYKVPKSVVWREQLPKSPVGKVLRKDLKALVAQTN